jgi:quercetin dioxygenase-like cupin family protein
MLLTLPPHEGGSGGYVVHSGPGFVYCLKGHLEYQVDRTRYLLAPGDVLVFGAALPHYCQNPGNDEVQFLLVLQPPHDVPEPLVQLG